MADPMSRNAETYDVLTSPAYAAAFEALARGEGDTLSEHERDAVRQARSLTGTPAPGLPMPIAKPVSPPPPAEEHT